jgi:hypothetical protein
MAVLVVVEKYRVAVPPAVCCGQNAPLRLVVTAVVRPQTWRINNNDALLLIEQSANTITRGGISIP